MYKKDLIRGVSTKTGISMKDVSEVVNVFLEEISDNLKNSGKVILTGFGSFQIVQTKERAGRNPQTGEAMQIPAKNKIKFVCGKELKDFLN
jgi:DNA-binding protein HU-beta